MGSMKISSFPAVATVIGVSQEVAESGPLLATLAVDPIVIGTPPPPPPPPPSTEPMDIQTGDPVTQAVVDNIIGKHPTKKESVTFKCEVCNIFVSSAEILNIHYSGSKHARKVKGQELVKEITNSPNSMFVVSSSLNGLLSNTNEFTCKMCNVRVNSYQQLQQHLSGSKHKNKAETKEMNTTNFVVPINQSGLKGEVSVDIGPNRLYCAACNVHVNSDLQLHQHITSSKHANKINGRTTPATRETPYHRSKNQGIASNLFNRNKKSFIPQKQHEQHNNWSKSNSDANWPKSNSDTNWPKNNSDANWPTNNSYDNWSNNNSGANWNQPSTTSAEYSGELYHRR